MITTFSALTAQEIEASYLATFDLGPGYPQIEVSPSVRELYLDDEIEETSLRFPPKWSPGQQRALAQELGGEVAEFLGIDVRRGGLNIRETFSGSIALDRALSASQRLANIEGKSRINVLTTSPCIDIMNAFILERPFMRVSYVESNLNGIVGSVDVDLVLDKISKLGSDRESMLVLLISSPENPTGRFWTSDWLSKVAMACVELNALLIVDHCFLVAGVHDQRLPAVWDLQLQSLRWIGIWDTGKTFGLNEDKLGFLIFPDEMSGPIDNSLSVMQFGVARRQKLFFMNLLRRSVKEDYVHRLRCVCRENMNILSIAAERSGIINPLNPPAGTLALVDISNTGLDDEQVRRHLMSKHIGVVAGRVFFHGDWKPTHLIRVALARDTDLFRRAVNNLADVLA